MEFAPISGVRCRLGESPFWWPERQSLYFVDTHAGDVHQWSAATGETQSAHVAERVTFVLGTTDGSLLLGLRHGLAVLPGLDAADGELTPALEVEADLEGNALNDVRADAAGRVWFGTMDRAERRPIGALYCIDPESGLQQRVTGVSLSNGIQFSPAGDVMYFVDSWTQRIDAFEYHRDTGQLGRRWTVVEIPADDGMPDGINVDAEGCIYVALYGAAELRRYRPDGTIASRTDVPVQFPTSCTFGGDDRRTLYITSALAGHTGTGSFKGRPRPARHESGLDGAVLVTEVDVPGVPSPLAGVRLKG